MPASEREMVQVHHDEKIYHDDRAIDHNRFDRVHGPEPASPVALDVEHLEAAHHQTHRRRPDRGLIERNSEDGGEDHGQRNENAGRQDDGKELLSERYAHTVNPVSFAGIFSGLFPCDTSILPQSRDLMNPKYDDGFEKDSGEELHCEIQTMEEVCLSGNNQAYWPSGHRRTEKSGRRIPAA